MAGKVYGMHGRDHAPDGMDPIPSQAAKISRVTRDTNFSVAAGASDYLEYTSFLTNDTDVFDTGDFDTSAIVNASGDNCLFCNGTGLYIMNVRLLSNQSLLSGVVIEVGPRSGTGYTTSIDPTNYTGATNTYAHIADSWFGWSSEDGVPERVVCKIDNTAGGATFTVTAFQMNVSFIPSPLNSAVFVY